MITLIIGVPDSGKSKLAEQLAVELAGNRRKYYIATMLPFGEEGKRRIQKHRAQREGKGFHTIECPVFLQTITEKISPDATVLLECMSNLIGNEIYADENQGSSKEELQDKILGEVLSLRDCCENLVIVTNEFALQNSKYDDETSYYVSMIHEINLKLRNVADDIYEFTEGEWKHHEIH
ncbi:MAG: bifunctional adenosylcobinamide kinase/adenosylcobinamide-phosphate guanylyltransferase [Lachnospiraceae bacterium]|nr:bifunctional adenosylcobinamide kinase/adenosylcobinamide-phosphate guanylyltransferase [Lachnospiraceae bacterium]